MDRKKLAILGAIGVIVSIVIWLTTDDPDWFWIGFFGMLALLCAAAQWGLRRRGSLTGLAVTTASLTLTVVLIAVGLVAAAGIVFVVYLFLTRF